MNIKLKTIGECNKIERALLLMCVCVYSKVGRAPIAALI